MFRQQLRQHWAVLVAVTLADVFEIANGIGSESGTGKFLHLAFPLIASGHKKSALICCNFFLRRAGGRTGGWRTAIGQLALDTTPKRLGRLETISHVVQAPNRLFGELSVGAAQFAASKLCLKLLLKQYYFPLQRCQ